MRIATFANSSQMLAASLKTQSRLSQMQLQTASGTKSSDYGGLGSVAGKVIDLESATKRATSYAETATTTLSRTESMYSALGSMTDLITSFKSTLSSYSVDQDAESLALTAASLRDEFVDLLNTRYEGRYLFGGNITDQEPVDLTSSDYSMDNLETEDTSYYQGNETVASVKISPNQTLNYGVLGSMDGFEQALRVFASFATSESDSLTSDQISSGLDILAKSMDNILVAQTKVSTDADTLTRAADRQTAIAASTKDLSSNYKDVDVTTISAQISTYQAQLEASFSALAKISKISLLNYQ